MSENTMSKSGAARRVSFLDDTTSNYFLRDGEGCLQLLLKGSYFVKVRPRGHYARLFQLEDDFSTLVWTPSSKQGRVRIQDVHEIRRGRNSPLLLDPDLDIDEDNAFSIVHGPDYLYIDLVADTGDEALIWQLLLVFIVRHLKKSGPGSTPVKTQLLEYAETLCTASPEIHFIVSRYGNGKFLTAQNFRHFLFIEQKLEVCLSNCAKVIREFEPESAYRDETRLTVQGLTAFLYSRYGDVFDHLKVSVYQDMTQPLCNYFIASSHNTYLSTSQKEGVSSLGAFYRILMKGSRYVEIDIYDGPNKSPIVRSYKSNGDALELTALAKMMVNAAFVASDYPLIVRIENHCSVQQQRKAAEIFHFYFKGALVESEGDARTATLPSPENLKRKVILVVKRLPLHCSAPAVAGTFMDGYVSEDDDTFEPIFTAKTESGSPRIALRRRSTLSMDLKRPMARNDSWTMSLSGWPESSRGRTDTGTSTSASKPSAPILTALELSQLSSVMWLRTFSDLQLEEPGVSGHMWSFNNQFFSALESRKPGVLARRHQRALSRVFPAFSAHADSSNFFPTEAWSCGAQCVALNWQTICTEMDLVTGMFDDNGGCGYVLKPRTLTQGMSTPPNWWGVKPVELTITIISGANLPDPFLCDFPTDVLDPFVMVSVYGASCDNTSWKTRACRNSRESPKWGESKTFKIHFPDVAMIRFHVMDADSIGSDFIGQYTLPFRCVSSGYRHVKLKSPEDRVIPDASLFVHATSLPSPCYSNFGRRCTKKNRKQAMFCQLTTAHPVDLHFKNYNSLLCRAIDLCYPADAALVNLKDACHMSTSCSMLELVRSLAAHTAPSAPAVCTLSVQDSFFPTITLARETAPELVRAFVRALSEGMEAIRNCVLGASSLVEEMQAQLKETRSKWSDVPEEFESLGMKRRQIEKAATSFYWNIGLLEMEIEEVKESSHRVKVAMMLLAECAVGQGLANLIKPEQKVRTASGT